MYLLSADALYRTIVKIRVFLKSDRDRSPHYYVSNSTDLIDLGRNVALSDPLAS
jgi:hypothetical protein